ncbi:unnamed protein product [Aspergillus oryzae RIB40]|uniref:DNA, SC003 n=2 Tax=Aspergillus oryzae TaxID=5062 RepID=Q2UMG8_ASPOR|nr:unnamed protein product [Aspergillus oryzae RIB40]EIT72871.1 hypothetical protein Ao3042_00962 [Aspergillus oryzae 3.042]KDE83520.1 hypothetical protein AO1008_10012 [Aspergillus oryzae 100-8]BAE57247.1 unnamed protein product [Aspergillus oryzae RIB40]|eukprot:EIT72871.1 hypothetical protein Ao3042_00962 [Aspergillus oryzae 3.042]
MRPGPRALKRCKHQKGRSNDDLLSKICHSIRKGIGGTSGFFNSLSSPLSFEASLTRQGTPLGQGFCIRHGLRKGLGRTSNVSTGIGGTFQHVAALSRQGAPFL